MMNQVMQEKIILSLGNQLVDWLDDIASTTITANELDINEELVVEVVQNNLGSIFRDFDGIDNPIFSMEGWEYYEELKDARRNNSEFSDLFFEDI